jgi:CitMHS family citrate-Mg2+:H+ or citrate-Ca2+:H+ symporter
MMKMMAAPPVSLWAMLTAAGVNMPYVGFFLPLLIPCVLLALATIFIVGRKARPADIDLALRELPEAPAGMNWFKVALPFLVFFALVLAGRIWPFDVPIMGLPFMFAGAAVVTVLLSPRKIHVLETARRTVHQLLPLVGTLTCVGVLVQIMTLTGVRGLIAVTVVTLPAMVVILTLFLTLPVSEAVLMWGAAPVLGVPLVLLFNTMNLNPVIALAGMSIIWPLGDAIPPTAIIGRLTAETIGMKEKYRAFLAECLVPAILIIIVGTLMVLFSKKLGFLTVF